MEIARLNKLTGRIIEAALRVHTALGPGVLESAYQACLLYELTKAGLKAIPQVGVPIVYDGQRLVDNGYRMDMLVELRLFCS